MSTHKEHEETYLLPILVFLILFALTAVTVLVSGAIHHDKLSLAAALIVATIKGSLVINYFMHVGHEGKLFKVFISVAVATLISIFVLLFTDYIYR